MFVYGEKVDMFHQPNEKHKELMLATREFMRRARDIVTYPPVYRVIPIKPYREYVKATKTMCEVGRWTLLH